MQKDYKTGKFNEKYTNTKLSLYTTTKLMYKYHV